MTPILNHCFYSLLPLAFLLLAITKLPNPKTPFTTTFQGLLKLLFIHLITVTWKLVTKTFHQNLLS